MIEEKLRTSEKERRTNPYLFGPDDSETLNEVFEPSANSLRGTELGPYDRRLIRQTVLKPVSGIVHGPDAGVAGNFGTFFIADSGYFIIALNECHDVAGSNAGAVTISVEKCASGVAPGSGVDILATPLSLKATARVPQSGTLTNTKEDLVLREGDRLVLKDTGTLTAVEDVCVTVILQEV